MKQFTINSEQLLKDYQNNNLEQLAAKYGFTEVTISRKLKELGIIVKPKKIKFMENEKIITRELLEKEYVDNKSSIKDIAFKYKLKYAAVWERLQKYNIPIRNGNFYKSLSHTKTIFNDLKLIEFSFMKNNQAHWLCECICGKRKTYRIKEVKSGVVKNCGCVRIKNKPSILQKYHDLFSYGAIKRKLEVSVSVEYIENLLIKQNFKCALTGLDIIIDYNYKIMTASLDRIDSKKGYIEGNLQWVHKDINMLKRTLTNEKLISYCELIVNHKNKQNNDWLANILYSYNGT